MDAINKPLDYRTKKTLMFSHKLTAQVHDTDAAAVVYFASFYRMAHTAYEAFMESIGFPIRFFLDEAEVLPLIVHSEADYKKPVSTGDKLIVELKVEKIGSTSYVLAYRIKNEESQTVARLKTAHVTVGKRSGRKEPLPEDFKQVLFEHFSSD